MYISWGVASLTNAGKDCIPDSVRCIILGENLAIALTGFVFVLMKTWIKTFAKVSCVCLVEVSRIDLQLYPWFGFADNAWRKKFDFDLSVCISDCVMLSLHNRTQCSDVQ